ncbi:molybdopterin molybdotransferase MoeA [Parapedobacter sp. DT-150]|uniref:molybdopterin molybdotransferase MoeA n=1 Tax=Parapedobacter sp. DT-150 TaxID=3396162 RepID=UPI003F1A9A14
MIGVDEAKAIIRQRVTPLEARKMTLVQALGCALAEDCHAKGDFPPFRQSAMDGYAFHFADRAAHGPLRVVGEVAAGSRTAHTLAAGEAMRIFTGAPLPDRADTVVMQEYAREQDGMLVIEDDRLTPGTNMRPQGSDIKNGQLAMRNGTVLTPAAIGFLAGIGITEVAVVPKPRIAIVVTGDELQAPGTPLQHGQVYESNSLTLCAALHQFHMADIVVTQVEDDLELISGRLAAALREADLVLVAGGISVGDHDYVKHALQRCGVEEQFYKVRQKPGKPLFFGMKDRMPVFGLPGNPASVLVCFYEYVVPALAELTNRQLMPAPVRLPLGGDVVKKQGLTYFLKGHYEEGAVQILSAQESYRLRSFAVSNCLVRLPEEMEVVNKGELVEVHPLP